MTQSAAKTSTIILGLLPCCTVVLYGQNPKPAAIFSPGLFVWFLRYRYRSHHPPAAAQLIRAAVVKRVTVRQ